MKKILQRLIALPVIALIVAAGASFAVLPSASVHAQDAKDAACEAIGGCNTTTAENQLNRTVRNVTNIFSVVVGIVAVIMIIVGGFKYVTSAGDSSKITSAKNTILYAIIGLVVVALAQVIVRFVLGSV